MKSAGIALRGVWAAVLTPIDHRLEPNAPAAIPYYRDLLRNGCDGLNVLGTNGEANSFGVGQRSRFMEAIAQSKIPLERVMVGTGTTSLDDTAQLTRKAFECGFTTALVMPPFFYRGIGDEGVVGYFHALAARTNPPDRGFVLYNWPAVSGVTFGAALVDRLVRELPGKIAGIKDSSNDVELQQAIGAQHADLAIFPSSEECLSAADVNGLAGCISGSVALWPQLAKSVYKSGEAALADRLARLRQAIAGPNMILRVRYLTGRALGDAAWERAMPPLGTLSAAEKRDLEEAISRCA
jgi:4-hydroxy-tetrahydrodipicolinate synthase